MQGSMNVKFTFQWIIEFSVPIRIQIFSCQDIAADNRSLFCGSTRQHKPFKNRLLLRLKRYKNPAYSRTPLIRINWEGKPTGHAENPDNWIFSFKIRYIRSLKWKKNFCKRAAGGHVLIYVQIEHYYIIP